MDRAGRKAGFEVVDSVGVNLAIAVKDDDWFEMLRRQPNLAEVNFWAPSAANFRALQSGERLLFQATCAASPTMRLA
jgi:hypothetical protein